VKPETKKERIQASLVMPETLDGLQARRKIRAVFPGVRVIMATFNDSAERRAAGVASGLDRFSPKERLRDELPGAIAELSYGRASGAEGARP
jgi:DNA-binding NarL/FixJ family response regulator